LKCFAKRKCFLQFGKVFEMQRQNRNEAEEGDRDALITEFSKPYHDGCISREWPYCPPRKTIDYEEGIAGKVIFDGKILGDKGLECTDCHPKVLPMKKETKIIMAKINKGKYCGAYHHGQEAFKPSEQTNCQRCHH
jgi:c(7)-type cytochrome triheme protein